MPSWGRQRGARLGQLRAQMAADEDDLVQFDKDDPDFARQDHPQDGIHGELARAAPSAGTVPWAAGGASRGPPPPAAGTGRLGMSGSGRRAAGHRRWIWIRSVARGSCHLVAGSCCEPVLRL